MRKAPTASAALSLKGIFTDFDGNGTADTSRADPLGRKSGGFLLLENGGRLLLENGGRIKLERGI
ncbi:MAG: hypothetical protein U1E62_05410 [Alsobacter sp.]